MPKLDPLQEIMNELYPESGLQALLDVRTGLTLFDVSLATKYSDVAPQDVDLSTELGGIRLPTPIISAAMDTVTGDSMARIMSDIGGCGIIYRPKKEAEQFEMVEEALRHPNCLVASPIRLSPDQTLEDASDLLREYEFSTLPVVSKEGKLLGVLFTKDVTFKGHEHKLVSKWMVTLAKLKTVDPSTPYETIRKRLLNEKNCSVLPVVDKDGLFHGMYFMKDFRVANPSTFNGRRLVGMAIGAQPKDLERVKEGLQLGVGIFCVDSSHGDSASCIEQSVQIAILLNKFAKKNDCQRPALIAGNVATPSGYYNLAQAGVDGVKCGIGSGSICTTSSVTGAGFPMFTLIRELLYTRMRMKEMGFKNSPIIIPDGGIGGPGLAARALAAGGDLVMAGEWLVAAKESRSFEEWGVNDGQLYYRGMASRAAIRNRVSNRYGNQKTAEEGIEGQVPYRGPMPTWIGEDLELLKGGFAHMGAANLQSLHQACLGPRAFVAFTGVGQQQNATRVEKKR